MTDCPARIAIRGGTATQRALLKHAAQVMMPLVLSQRQLPYITVTVTLAKKLRDEGLNAECACEENNIRPRSFLVHIAAKQSKKELLLSLAHELVHVYQYTTGKLFEFAISEDKVKWKGRIMYAHKISYMKQPWEIEAFKRQKELYRAYLDIVKVSKRTMKYK